jgi:hypothetical protein
VIGLSKRRGYFLPMVGKQVGMARSDVPLALFSPFDLTVQVWAG